MLTSRIHVPHSSSPTPESILSEAISTIFPDDTVNSHGDPGSGLIYTSSHYGKLHLRVPDHPDEEAGRKLFAHFLWNAALVIAEGIENGSQRHSSSSSPETDTDAGADQGGKVVWQRRHWDVKGLTVLELGAGTGLPSIIAAVAGAGEVVVTDHPGAMGVVGGVLGRNVRRNLERRRRNNAEGNGVDGDLDNEKEDGEADDGKQDGEVGERWWSDCDTLAGDVNVKVYGYVWGTTTFYDTTSYGKAISINDNQSFNRIILADTLWMPSQHINLLKTILMFLPDKDDASHDRNGNKDQHDGREQGCAIVVAGFHTGRNIVANFFDLATEPWQSDRRKERVRDPPWNARKEEEGDELQHNDDPLKSVNLSSLGDNGLTEEELQYVGKLRLAQIFEISVDLNTRPWQKTREGEGKWEAKRWCVVGILVRK